MSVNASYPPYASAAERMGRLLGLPAIEAEECGADFEAYVAALPEPKRAYVEAHLDFCAYRYACNWLRSYVRHYRQERRAALAMVTEELEAGRKVEELMEQAELCQRVQRALGVLRAEQRRLVWAHLVDGASYKEIALEEGRSVEAVRKACERAEARLREALLAEGVCLERTKGGRYYIAIHGGGEKLAPEKIFRLFLQKASGFGRER
jgi:RNA polymerase sigma factor (sigma-70 family)